MSSFIILEKKGDKKVLFKGNFDKYRQYSDITKTMFEKIKKLKVNLQPSDKFKLSFDDIEKCYIPEEVSQGIYDEESYSFFLNKLDSKGITNLKYKFYIEKVDSFPKFEKKESYNILSDNLKKYWDIILNDITSYLNIAELDKSNSKFNMLLEEQKQNEENLKKIKHDNIICSNCFKKDFCGKRFICSECENYNLCQDCENILHEKEIHLRGHVLIQVIKCLNEDIFKYNNIIGNYRKEFINIDQSFNFEFEVINNGENNLQNCYILPIRYGEEYLYCKSKKITDLIQRGANSKISLEVKLPKKNGYFEGYFRMFTPNGLPFGNVINIKVLNGN